MTFDSRESHAWDGQPVFLLDVSHGSQTWHMTTAAFPLDYNGHTYAPTAFTFDRVIKAAAQDRSTTTITLQWDCPFAKYMLGDIPLWQIKVDLFASHHGETQVAPLFSGVATGVKFSPGLMVMSCAPPGADTPRPPVRRHFTRYCPHQLYGAGCNINALNFKVDTTISTITGAVMKLPSGWNGAYSKLDFLYGLATWYYALTWEYGYIVNIDTAEDKVTLAWPPFGLKSGSAVGLSLGCDKTAATCETRFNNIANFGGVLVQLTDSFVPFGTEAE